MELAIVFSTVKDDPEHAVATEDEFIQAQCLPEDDQAPSFNPCSEIPLAKKDGACNRFAVSALYHVGHD